MARSITVLTISLVVGLLVGCGNDFSKPLASVAQPEPAVPSPTQVALDHVGDQPLTEVEEVTAKKTEAPSLPAEPKSEGTPEVYAEKPTKSYDGNATLEERIATADVIAVARMDSVVASGQDYNHEGFEGGTSTAQSFVAALNKTTTTKGLKAERQLRIVPAHSSHPVAGQGSDPIHHATCARYVRSPHAACRAQVHLNHQ